MLWPFRKSPMGEPSTYTRCEQAPPIKPRSLVTVNLPVSAVWVCHALDMGVPPRASPEEMGLVAHPAVTASAAAIVARIQALIVVFMPAILGLPRIPEARLVGDCRTVRRAYAHEFQVR